MTDVTMRDITELRDAMSRLSTLIETEGLRCPYREKIGQASNNVERLKTLEARLRETELKVAGIAGLSGGGVAGAVIVIGKALGWI